MNPSFDVNSDQDFELAFAGLVGKDFVGSGISVSVCFEMVSGTIFSIFSGISVFSEFFVGLFSSFGASLQLCKIRKSKIYTCGFNVCNCIYQEYKISLGFK